MNLDDLRAELDAHAKEIDPHTRGRMAGIRARVAARRRRKAGATVAASVLAVGAIIAVPVASHLTAGPEPAKQAPFPDEIDGDTLIAAEMGDEGATKVKLTFTPDDTDFLLDIECNALTPVDDDAKARLNASVLRVRVNGKAVYPSCGQAFHSGGSPAFVGGVAPRDQISEFWQDGGLVEAGEPVTITLQVARDYGKPRKKSIDGRIGVGVYDMTGERVRVADVAFPQQKSVEGETYELGRYDVATGDATAASVDVPDLDEAALVTYGETQDYRGNQGKIAVDGRRGVLEVRNGVSNELLPDGTAHTVAIDYPSGQSPRADVFVAYYTRVDDSDEESETFPDEIDGDTLIASEMGDEGATKVKLTFTPEDTDFLLKLECAALRPERPGEGRGPMDPFLYVRVNDRPVTPACGAYGGGAWKGSVGGVRTRDEIRRFWEQGGVEAGESVTVLLRITGEGRVPKRIDGRLGVAVYDMTGERTEAEGFAFTEQKTVAGQAYELGGYDVASGRSSAAKVEVPALGNPALVTYGVPQLGVGNRAHVRVDGVRGVLASHGSLESAVLPDSDSHMVSVDGRGAGQAVVAYYIPLEGTETDGVDAPEIEFPEVNDSRDPLIASEIAEPERTVFRTRFTPDGTDVELVVACEYDGTLRRSHIRMTVEVNGTRIDRGRCRPQSSFKLGDLAGVPRVDPGEPLDVAVRTTVEDYAFIEASEIAVGAALYDCSAPRVDVNGFLLPREYRHNGVWYELADSESVNVEPGQRRVTLHRRPGKAPIVVAWGFMEPTKGWAQTWVDGGRIDLSLRSGALNFKPAPGSSQDLLTKAIMRFDGGKLMIAYYVPEK